MQNVVLESAKAVSHNTSVTHLNYSEEFCEENDNISLRRRFQIFEFVFRM